MNYEKLYWELIRKGVNRKITISSKRKAKSVGCEIHHAIPKSLGGSNADWNEIPLTVKEHALAHLLLLRWLGKDDCAKTILNCGNIRRYGKKRIIGYAMECKKYNWNGEGLLSSMETNMVTYLSDYSRKQDKTRADIVKRICSRLLNNMLVENRTLVFG